MAQAKVVETIEASADAVWQQLSDFGGIKPGPGIDAVEFEGEGVGMLRRMHLPNGIVEERLEIHDSVARTFTYVILNDDNPLPFTGYSATVSMTDNGDGTTTVDWTGTFEPRGVEESKAVRIATGIYTGMIKAARKALTT